MTTDTELDLPAMRAASSRACALMRVMANIQQPTLSQQLAVLREESLVTTRRDGKQVYYSIDSGAAMDVLNVLYAHFCAEQPNAR